MSKRRKGRLPSTRFTVKTVNGDYPFTRCRHCSSRYKGKITDVETGKIKIISCEDSCVYVKCGSAG